jgi:ankyrin repeat protein
MYMPSFTRCRSLLAVTVQSKGAMVGEKDKSGETALILAAQNGHKEIVDTIFDIVD